MKASIRTKFTIGVLFFFVIILILSIFSAYYLNRLSKKTGAILRENHLSVIYARDMSESLMNIDQEITNGFMTNKSPNIGLIKRETDLFGKSLKLEKDNITEPGEDKIVAGIETGFDVYNDSLQRYLDSPQQVTRILFLQKEYGILYKQLMLLSQINEKAIELKTDDAKVSAKNALTQMAFIGTFCFLLALSFTYSFASYFNERFFQLYNGIKELVPSNYGQRLYFDTKDEFYDISLVFNEMAAKLSDNNQKIGLNLQLDSQKKENSDDIQELKRILIRMKGIEEEANSLILRFEKEKQ